MDPRFFHKRASVLNTNAQTMGQNLPIGRLRARDDEFCNASRIVQNAMAAVLANDSWPSAVKGRKAAELWEEAICRGFVWGGSEMRK